MRKGPVSDRFLLPRSPSLVETMFTDCYIASEWDASCVSSEQMEGITEVNSMQVMKGLDQPETA